MWFGPRAEHLRTRLLRAAFLSVTSLTLLVGGAGAAAAAANVACPKGFETITVEQAISEGYLRTPALVDGLGNGDGTVCRRALGDGNFHSFPGTTVDTIYNWIDNATPR
jgi:hypothetical protein